MYIMPQCLHETHVFISCLTSGHLLSMWHSSVCDVALHSYGASVEQHPTSGCVYCITAYEWTVYCRHARKLNRFHTSCLGRLFRITWQDMIPDAGLQMCRAAKHSCSTEESSTSMGWPCCQNERWKVTKAPAVWRTVRGEEVYWRSTQTL